MTAKEGAALSFRQQFEDAILKLMRQKLESETVHFEAATIADKPRTYPKSDALARLQSFLLWRGDLWCSSAWLRVHRGISSQYMAMAINGAYPEDLVAGEWHSTGGRRIYRVNAINRMMAARAAINELVDELPLVSQRKYNVYDYILPADIEVVGVWTDDELV